MKKIIGLAIFAGASLAGAGAANAEVSANVALTSDYVFRGVSLSGEDPAVQGGFDYSNDFWYAGVWASSLAASEGASSELDLYAGITPSTGPVNWDLGLVSYWYPGADDDGTEFDYVEGKIAASVDVTDALTLGAAFYYSPENFGETGEAIYYEANVSYEFNDALKITGAVGSQSIDDVDGPGGANLDDDYVTWNVGVTHAFHGFEIDLRYHEADIGANDPIALAGYATEQNAEGRFVLTVSREL